MVRTQQPYLETERYCSQVDKILAGIISRARKYTIPPPELSPRRGMHTSRVFASATLMGNGNVLVAGGWTYVPPAYPILSEAEVYNPSTGRSLLPEV